MGFEISGFDLLYVALAVVVYAGGATLWAYFAIPPIEFDRLGAPNSGTDFFEKQVEEARS